MLIDWFTVAAQLINFLLLVWLLKRFLYGRILVAIESRERGIAERLAQAAADQKAAAGQLALYQAKLREFEEQRETLLSQARQDAGREHAELLSKARDQVHSLEATWQENLDRERDAFLADLRRRAAAEILALARQTVADLASVDIQRCAVQVFLEKLRSLDRDQCQALAKGELAVRTPLDLPQQTQSQIEQALRDQLQTPVNLHFERVPGIGLGIELRGNGWRIGWDSETYLDTLEQDLRPALEHTRALAAHAGTR